MTLLIHLVLLLAGGLALFALWRATSSSQQRLFRTLVATGFLVRAIIAQALFWISYLRLPIGRQLQVGNGLWFFATDAAMYMRQANSAAASGPWTIITYFRSAASVSYIQALATFSLLFGGVASVGILLNLFCYLGSCFIFVRWSQREPSVRGATLIAIAAISLSPSFILWSLQPLKETLFQFLTIAFVSGCALWQRASTARSSVGAVVGAAAVMTVTLFAIAGLRWYFAFAALLGSWAFLLLVVIVASGRRIAAAASALLLAFLMSRAFLFGAGPYVPPHIQALLSMRERKPAVVAFPSSIVREMDEMREGFDRTGGATLIRVASRQRPNQDVATAPTRPDEDQKFILPSSRAGRMASGTAALLVPRTLAQPLGLFRIGGGRGMWWFTDLDTLTFDAALLYAMIVLLQRIRSAALRNPLFWLIFLVTTGVSALVTYTVTNFGTLFRLREMIYLGLALIPLALAAGPATPRKAVVEGVTDEEGRLITPSPVAS